MADEGAALQTYNTEMVNCLADLRKKRKEINIEIDKSEKEKNEIKKKLGLLTDRMSVLNEELGRQIQTRNEYDKTIERTEGAYMKILENSQSLLQMLKNESVSLAKKKQSSAK